MKSGFNIDDYLSRSMDEFEVQPRITSFDAVLDKLAKKKKRRFLFILFFGFGLSLLSSIAFLYNSAEAKTTAANDKVANIAPAAPEHLQHPKLETPTTLPNTLTAKKNNKTKVPGATTPITKPSSSPTEVQEVKIINSTSSEQPTETLSSALLPITAIDSILPQIASEPANLLTIAIHNPDSTASADSVEQAPIALLNTNVTKTFPLPTDSQTNTKKLRRFMIGIHANPQYSSLLLRENKNRNPWYDSISSGSFSDVYLKSRKEQNTFNFNYAVGLMLGYQINDKWEVWINGGFQHTVYYENYFLQYQNNTLTGSGSIPMNTSNNVKQTRNGYKNVFAYRSFGLNFSRSFRPNPFLTLVLNVGASANNLFYSSAIYAVSPNAHVGNYAVTEAQTSKRTYSTNLKLGVVKELNSRLQCRLSPGVFCSPGSMFKKNYVIKQYSYGFELEGALIFKVF